MNYNYKKSAPQKFFKKLMSKINTMDPSLG